MLLELGLLPVSETFRAQASTGWVAAKPRRVRLALAQDLTGQTSPKGCLREEATAGVAKHRLTGLLNAVVLAVVRHIARGAQRTDKAYTDLLDSNQVHTPHTVLDPMQTRLGTSENKCDMLEPPGPYKPASFLPRPLQITQRRVPYTSSYIHAHTSFG